MLNSQVNNDVFAKAVGFSSPVSTQAFPRVEETPR